MPVVWARGPASEGTGGGAGCSRFWVAARSQSNVARAGFRNAHTIVWEIERLGKAALTRTTRWPNNFSRLLGDKAFGLLVVDTLGFLVPWTTVVPRRLAPFSFGTHTSTTESWLRTAPQEPVPGRFTTVRGWQDPFALLQREDSNEEISSVLAQEGVDASFSGAGLVSETRELVEGVSGYGDQFMLDNAAPQKLPSEIYESALEIGQGLRDQLGAVKFDWVHDSEKTWLVQMQSLTDSMVDEVILDGEASHWRSFPVSNGLEALRELVDEIKAKGEGVILEGDVGLTSHFGDLLRRAGVPSRLRH